MEILHRLFVEFNAVSGEILVGVHGCECNLLSAALSWSDGDTPPIHRLPGCDNPYKPG